MDKNKLKIRNIQYDYREWYTSDEQHKELCRLIVTLEYGSIELKHHIPTTMELTPEEIKELTIRALKDNG